jgi:hypothetical protein
MTGAVALPTTRKRASAEKRAEKSADEANKANEHNKPENDGGVGGGGGSAPESSSQPADRLRPGHTHGTDRKGAGAQIVQKAVPPGG